MHCITSCAQSNHHKYLIVVLVVSNQMARNSIRVVNCLDLGQAWRQAWSGSKLFAIVLVDDTSLQRIKLFYLFFWYFVKHPKIITKVQTEKK